MTDLAALTVAAAEEHERGEAMWREHIARRQQLCQQHPLEYLFLEVTRRCNLACVYCGSSCGPKAQHAELSMGDWLQIVRQVAADFDPRRIMVAVTGGEPLCRPDVFLLFEELARLGFPYGIVSNGVLLDDHTARKLVDAGVGSISLSMDAPPELNDRLRGAGTSAGVVKAVEALRKAGFSGKLEIISTITRPAVGLLEPMRAVVAGLRIPLWRVAPVMPIGRAARHPDLLPGPEEIRHILEFVRTARGDEYDPRPEMSEEGYVGNRFEGRVRPYLCQCRAGVTIAGVLCDGSIGACPELGDAFVQGHIRNHRLSELWQDGYRVFRDRAWMQRGECASCQHWARCEGGAMHLYPDAQSAPLRCLYLLAKQGGG